MQEQTLEKLRSMDDFQILRFFNHFNNSLVKRANISGEEVLNDLPDEVKEMDEMETVLQMQDEFGRPLEQKEAAQFARLALEEMANNPQTENLLVESLSGYKDDEMAAGVILAFGAAVSFIILISAGTLKYSKENGFEYLPREEKEINAITRLVKTLLGAIPESILKLKNLK